MVIMAKRAVLFLDHKTGREFRAPNGYLGNCPDWVAKTRQFSEMVNDGMIVASDTSRDKDLAAAEETVSKKDGKGGKSGKKPEAAPEDKSEEGASTPEGVSAPKEPEE